MVITKENIGDILCLYQTADFIRIIDVTPRYVYYEKEYGAHYATHAHVAAALPVTDPARLAVFETNSKLGRVLLGAEQKARERLLFSSDVDLQDAKNALETSLAQQKELFARLDKATSRENPGADLAARFLSQLSAQSTGSHDTFWGHDVQLVNAWSYEIRIDGQAMDYASAEKRLSAVCYRDRAAEAQKKMSLNDRIRGANSRRDTNSLAGKDPLVTDIAHNNPDR